MARLSLRRRFPRSAVVWFVVAGGSAALAFAGVRDMSARAAADVGVPTTSVVVATGDLDGGAVLDAVDVRLEEVPAPAPPGALRDAEQAVGALAVTPFVPGEVITSTRLARPASALTARIPPGLLGVPIEVAALPVGLSVGDRVDVLATFASARPYTTSVASDVPVLQVPTGGRGIGAAADGTGLLVLASPEVARQLVQAGATGTLAVAIRGYEPLGVTVEDGR